MKILIVTTKSPYPPCEGMTLRTYNLIKYLHNRHDIYLISYIQDDIENLDYLKRYCKSVSSVNLKTSKKRMKLALLVIKSLFSGKPFITEKYDSKEIRQKIRKLIEEEKIDLVHFDLLHVAHLHTEVAGTPKILVEHNIESSLLERRLKNERNIFVKAYLYLEWLKLKKYEKEICNKFNYCVAVSKSDKKILSKWNISRVAVIPNGVDTEYFRPQSNQIEKNSLVFVGNLSWFPNMDGMRYFIAQIFPIIIKVVPKIKLYIIGKKVSSNFVPNEYKRYIFQLGRVEDIRPIVGKAAVYIVPLRVGGGTRLKIVDAMAMGKAIVSTTIGCEGIEVKDKENIFIADTPREFAENVIDLLNKDELNTALGKKARELVEKKYDWKDIYKGLEKVYNIIEGEQNEEVE